MPQQKNKTREEQYSLADRERIMADLFPMMVGSKPGPMTNNEPYDPTVTYDTYFRGGKSTSPKKVATFNNKELAREKSTGEALNSTSAITSTALPFLTSAIPAKAARVAGDVPFYGGLRPGLSQAFQSENPDDRLNSLMSLAAITGLDLATDAGVHGVNFLYSKVMKKPINPYVLNLMLVGKNNAMTPAYTAVDKKITDLNAGRKTAEALKLVDNFLLDSDMQEAWRNSLPILKDMAYGYGNQKTSTNMQGLAAQRAREVQVPGEANAPFTEILRPLQMTIPRNLPVAQELAADNLSTLGRKERGMYRDLATVEKGVTGIASKFGNDMRKNLGMAAIKAAPVVGQVASEVNNIGDKFGSAMRSLLGKLPMARK